MVGLLSGASIATDETADDPNDGGDGGDGVDGGNGAESGGGSTGAVVSGSGASGGNEGGGGGGVMQSQHYNMTCTFAHGFMRNVVKRCMLLQVRNDQTSRYSPQQTVRS